MNKTTTTTQQLVVSATLLPEAALKLTTFDIADTFADDQDAMGDTLRANIVAFAANPDLINYHTGFTNLIELSGGVNAEGQEEIAIARALKLLGKGAVVVTRNDSPEDMRTSRCALCNARYMNGEMDYKDTEFGPVIRLKVRPENQTGPEQVVYINPFNFHHFEFLSALYAFPVLFWATVCEGNVHVSVLRASMLTKGIEEYMKLARRAGATLAEQGNQRDFAKAVDIVCANS